RFAVVELPARDDDVGAALGERLHHLVAEAAAPAGDERDLAREVEVRIGRHRFAPRMWSRYSSISRRMPSGASDRWRRGPNAARVVAWSKRSSTIWSKR